MGKIDKAIDKRATQKCRVAQKYSPNKKTMCYKRATMNIIKQSNAIPTYGVEP